MAATEVNTNKSSNEELLADEKPKFYNKNNSTLDRKNSDIKQSQVGSWLLNHWKGTVSPVSGGETSFFDAYSLSITDYEHEDIP